MSTKSLGETKLDAEHSAKIQSQPFEMNETKSRTFELYVELNLSTMNLTLLSVQKFDHPLINRRSAQSNQAYHRARTFRNRSNVQQGMRYRNVFIIGKIK